MGGIASASLRLSSIFLIGALACLAGPAASAPMNCAAAATPVEKAMCASPVLVAADRKMAAAFAQRLAQCPESEREQLRHTQKFWLRDRNACSNLLSDDDPQAVARCAADRMNERIAQLSRIGAACKLDAVAEEYRYVDTDYLAAHAGAYEDREVSAWGDMRLTTCDVRSSDLTGMLEPEAGKSGFPVRFKALSALQRERLCARNPAAHWTGTVRREGGTTFLYLRDLLGEPL
jgi:uncharacterized protein